MKNYPGYLDLFISPVSGLINISGNQSLTTDYIWVGDLDNFAIESPILIDIRLDIINIRRKLNNTPFIIQYPVPEFYASQALSLLDPGIMKQTDGVVATAIAGTDYYSPGNPTYLTDTYASETYNVGVGTNNFTNIMDGGIQNLAFGDDVLTSITSGNYNISIGNESLYNLTTGTYNVAVGILSLHKITTDSFNVAVGNATFLNMTSTTSSQNNTGVGHSAGSDNDIYNQCCFFGDGADASANNLTNSMAFGYNTKVGTSNTAVLGNVGLTTVNIPGLNLSFVANTIKSSNSNGNLVIAPNGTGAVQLNNGTNVTPLQFYNSAGTHYVAFQAGTLTANTTWTLPTTDSTGSQALVSNGSGTLSWAAFMGNSLPEGNIWIGNSDNIATPQPTIAITNLPDLPNYNIWIGDESDRPVPNSQISIVNLPDLTYGSLWTGDSSNNVIETTTITIDNLPDLTSGNIWRGDSSNRPEESADLSNLENTVADLQAQVDEIQAQVDILEGDVALINAAIAAIQAELVVIAGEIAALQTQVIALDAAVAILQTQVIALDAAVAALQAYVQSITLTQFVIGGPPDPTTGVIVTSRGPTCLLTNIPAGGNVDMGTYAIYDLAPIPDDIYDDYINGQSVNFDWLLDFLDNQQMLVGFVPQYIFPTITLPGQTQIFQFQNYQSLSQFQVKNIFAPILNNISQNCIEFVNINSSGFRFRQITSSESTYGQLVLENFENGSIPGTPLITFEESEYIQFNENLNMDGNAVYEMENIQQDLYEDYLVGQGINLDWFTSFLNNEVI